jgi:6-hydroxycyclohex-1-ene-1-carbonyl-CoA dehydrogenase
VNSIDAWGYRLMEPNAPLARETFTIDSVADDDVVVKVAGCGLCHTDISFYSGQVRPNQLPVILGHEISGTVVAAGANHGALDGKAVIIPAVLPCGDCDLCHGGRGNVCRSQKFPGNDFDGGFASHVTVPGRFLCELPGNLGGLDLAELSVIADAVTTPYQAAERAKLGQDDLAIVVGVGGIGIYMVQHATARGARVIALDVDAGKLETAAAMGAHFTLDTSGMSEGDVKKAVRGLAKENGLPRYGWKVFETSGTAPGQAAAFALLSFAGTLAVVGFTMDTVTIRLSNAMAFDAEIFGNWACKPEHYPAVAEACISGSINLKDNVEQHSLDSINEIIPRVMNHEIQRRVVFTP